MRNSKSLNTTFEKIRELPLEISIEQVRLWVEQAPPVPLKETKYSFFKWLRSSWNNN